MSHNPIIPSSIKDALVLASQGSSGGGNYDQILNLLLQLHQASSAARNNNASSSSAVIPKEVVMQLLLNQKLAVQQRWARLAEELNALRIKAALLDEMLANEASNNDNDAIITSLAAAAAGNNVSSFAACAPSPGRVIVGACRLTESYLSNWGNESREG